MFSAGAGGEHSVLGSEVWLEPAYKCEGLRDPQQPSSML